VDITFSLIWEGYPRRVTPFSKDGGGGNERGR